MATINYIGIDISKNFFDIAYHEGQDRRSQPSDTQYQARFSNDAKGISAFIKSLKNDENGLPKYFIVLESTGGYEMQVLLEICKNNIPVHRADPLTSKNFICSLNKRAKTDQLDAKALARYAFERRDVLNLFTPKSEDQDLLSILVSRRNDLVQMRQAEENRLNHPNYKKINSSVKAVIKILEKEIAKLEEKMRNLIKSSAEMSQKMAIMQEMKGVGERTAMNIVALMPEIGKLSRREIASLAGCAPHPRESGNHKGYRKTIGGRQIIKRSLFLAAMSARMYNPKLREFYERLIANGKKKMVALTAVMRKIITILNAKIRDLLFANQQILNHGR